MLSDATIGPRPRSPSVWNPMDCLSMYAAVRSSLKAGDSPDIIVARARTSSSARRTQGGHWSNGNVLSAAPTYYRL